MTYLECHPIIISPAVTLRQLAFIAVRVAVPPFDYCLIVDAIGGSRCDSAQDFTPFYYYLCCNYCF